MRCSGIGLFSEYNVIRPIGRPKVRIALVYPSTYQASITNLFTHIAYFYIYDNVSNVLVDRFTLDNMCEGALTRQPLSKFDYVLASIGFELDLLGLVRMLTANGIEPLKRNRKGGRPVIVVGGPPVTANPLIAKEIADISFIGEAEALLKALVDTVERGGRTAADLLESLECVGVRNSAYTGVEESVTKYVVRNLSHSYVPAPLIRSCMYEPVYGDGYYIEISRGCKWLCPFCMEAFVSHPLRIRGAADVKSLITEGLKYVKRRRVVFYSLSFFDHPSSDELLKWLLDSDCSYSIPSIRYHTMNAFRVGLIKAGGQRTLTIAPETGDEGSAELIGKQLDVNLLKELVRQAMDLGLNVKLYFMLGLPGEDRRAGLKAGELVRKIINGLRGRRVKVAVNPLVPKSMTPCQYLPLISKEEFNRKLGDLIRTVKGLGVQVEHYGWDWAWVQSTLSLGGEWVSHLVVKWAEMGGGIATFKSVIGEFVKDPLFVLKVRDVSESMPSDIVIHDLQGLILRKGEELVRSLNLN